MAKTTVLYVEDEENDILFMKLAFKQVGLELVLQPVVDGQKAIAYLAGEGGYADRGRYPLPALILLDLNLPLISGFEVLEWLRKQPELAWVPVVIFSSSGRPEDREKAHELGANDYVLKPASGMQFSEIVRTFHQRWIASGDLRGSQD
jgi:CheY-like chemotaxis protein